MKTGSDSEDYEDDVADKHQGVTPAAVKDVDNPVDLAVKDVDNPVDLAVKDVDNSVDDCEVPAKSTDTVLNICQYKDIPVWSVTVGRPEDRTTKDCVTLLAKIQKRYLVS